MTSFLPDDPKICFFERFDKLRSREKRLAISFYTRLEGRSDVFTEHNRFFLHPRLNARFF